MKPKKIITGIIAVLCVAVMFAFVRADDDPIKKIITQLSKWTDTDPQEKVYLHMDKPFYAAGEDIWFKAYITIGEKHQLSALSAVLNVELINEKDSVKQSVKLPVSNGVTWGGFALPDSLKAGNYRIRAYTNYMRNAGDEYFFDKTFVIGNSVNNNIFTKVNYQYTTQNGQPKINAAITYTNLNGVAYANKEVSYDVQLDFRSIAKGKGITDGNGVLNVSFVNNMPVMLKAGRIVTSIKYDDKKASTQTLAIKAASDKVDVQFFPEGGNLVNGLRGKVAFKATGADGLGVDIKGIVKDNTNTDVARLNPSHFGMGYVVFAPESGKTYKAVLTMADGSESTVALPVAVDVGYTLSVMSTDAANLIMKIGASQTLVDQGDEISVVAQQSGKVYYAAKTKITKGSFAAAIPKSRFPSGIVQFTLFSGKGEPLAERIVFIQNPDLLKLAITTEKQSYGPRQQVKLSLNAKDATDKPIVGSFSVAVTDETKVPVDESAETTILSHLLLTSDLKGYIEKPNYYFTNPTGQTQAELDALMLTQGYRRFVWKQVLNDTFPAQAFQPEKSLTISGTIKTSGGKPVPKAKVTIFTTSGGFFLMDSLADDQGRFAFKNLVFKDSIRFVVQARTPKNSKFVEIELDNAGIPIVTKNKNAPDIQVSTNNVLSNYLQNSKSQYQEQLKYGLGNHVTALKEVVITEKKKSPIENSSNLNGAGNADQVIKSDQLSTCPTLEMCLQGRANFVIFREGMAYSTRSPNKPMQIVLDGMTMSEDFTLDNISPMDVESVEVLRTIAYTSMYGMRGGGGVLVITTKRGGSTSDLVRYAPGIVTYAPKGYYRSREFYAPKYDDPKTNANVADLRTTIYWKPNIVTDKEGNAAVAFFNADSKGTYMVVVEGIDSDGNLGRQVFRYKVE
jgi:hypothetical protein